MANIKTQPIELPEFTAVFDLVQEYIELLNQPDTIADDLSNFESQVFEAVIEAYYGKKIWDEINPILNEL